MFKNIGSNWALVVVTIAITYVLTPFMIETLGKDGYGVWSLVVSVTDYLALLLLGVPTATVRFVAEHVARKDQEKINRALGSAFGLYGVLGAAAIVVGAALFAFFALAYDVPGEWSRQARAAFGLIVLTTAVGFVGNIPYGVMAAHHDFVVRNFVLLGKLVLRFGLTLTLLSLKASLVLLAIVQVCCLAFEFSVSWFLLHRRYPGTRISLACFDRGMVRQILEFSIFVVMLNVGVQLSFQTDALVIGAYLSVGEISVYAIANSLVVYLMEFFLSIAAVVMPTAINLRASGREAELRVIFLTWSKISFSVALMAGLYLFVLGPAFIGSWIGPSFEEPSGAVLRVLVLSFLVFLPVRGAAMPILMGVGRAGGPAIAFLASGILNLVLSLALVGPLKLIGVAIGCVFR